MRSTPRSAKVVALLAGTALIAAACGSSKAAAATTTGRGRQHRRPRPPRPAPSTSAGETGSSDRRRPRAAMTLTIKINPKAVWDDGTPITVDDFECSLQATLNTPGSLSTVGYDKITSIDASDPDDHVVVKFYEACTRRTRTCSRPTADHQGGRRRQLRRRLRPTCRTTSRSRVVPWKHRLVEQGPGRPRPERQVLGRGRHAQGHQGRHGAEGRQRHRDQLAEVGRGRLHLPAGVRRHHRRPERPEHQVHPGLRHELRGSVLPGRHDGVRSRTPTSARRSRSRSTAT